MGTVVIRVGFANRVRDVGVAVVLESSLRSTQIAIRGEIITTVLVCVSAVAIEEDSIGVAEIGDKV